MSTYKELADAVDNVCEDGDQRDQIAAILRSLDAQRPTVDEVMAQAQVFASAWSLVGSRFVSGSGLEEAEQEKKDLRTAIEALAAPVAAQPTREQIQRERMEGRKTSRAPSPATADFDLPAQSDEVAAQPQQAKPLSDAEIWADDGIMSANSRVGASFEALRELVRAVEKRYGIKEQG